MMRQKVPDTKNARSILEEAEREMKYTLKILINDESAFTIVRNIYECFRMLGDAILINNGHDNFDHVDSMNALLHLNIDSERPLNSIDILRNLRHNINYYGYHPTKEEALDAIDIGTCCFYPLLKYIKGLIG